MSHESPDLASIDYFIRRYTNTAQVSWDMAEYFTQHAREQEMLAQEYIEQRNTLLGQLGLDGVVIPIDNITHIE